MMSPGRIGIDDVSVYSRMPLSVVCCIRIVERLAR